MADVRPHPAGRTPRRHRGWIEIAVVPPEQPRSGIETVAVHAGFSRFGHRGDFYAIRFLEVTEVNVIMSVAAISLASRDGVERWILKLGRRAGNDFISGVEVGDARG